MIENGEEAVYEEHKIEEQDVIFLMDRFGYARTIDVSTYERNKDAADTENKVVIACKNTGRICLFTNTGENAPDQGAGSAVWKIPGQRRSCG